MKFRYFSGIFSAALLAGLALLALAQMRTTDDVVRSFESTRGKVGTPSGNDEKKRPIGLRCTIFKRGQNGRPVRVGESQEFSAGDAVRLMVESNISGYLYVFHTENNRPAKMLFPDFRLQSGNNFIRAYIPHEVPSSKEEDPKFRWLYFNDTVAIERFYFLVTREPLPDVLIGEKLVTYCRENPKDCPWRPSGEQWTKILADAKTDARENKRDVNLPSGTPAPPKVKLNVSPKAGRLLMNIDLIHK